MNLVMKTDKITKKADISLVSEGAGGSGAHSSRGLNIGGGSNSVHNSFL